MHQPESEGELELCFKHRSADQWKTNGMYGVPSTQKSNISLRPILSMVGSSQHEVA